MGVTLSRLSAFPIITYELGYTGRSHIDEAFRRAGQKLNWDAAALRATNCPEADRFIRREPRPGWKLG